MVNQYLMGGDLMATKSILKDINIKNKELAKRFIDALDHSQNKSVKIVQFNKSCKDVTGDNIKKIFGA